MTPDSTLKGLSGFSLHVLTKEDESTYRCDSIFSPHIVHRDLDDPRIQKDLTEARDDSSPICFIGFVQDCFVRSREPLREPSPAGLGRTECLERLSEATAADSALEGRVPYDPCDVFLH